MLMFGAAAPAPSNGISFWPTVDGIPASIAARATAFVPTSLNAMSANTVLTDNSMALPTLHSSPQALEFSQLVTTEHFAPGLSQSLPNLRGDERGNRLSAAGGRVG